MQISNMHMTPFLHFCRGGYGPRMDDSTASEYKAATIRAVASWVSGAAKSAGLSKSKLAERAGISDTTVTRGMTENSTSTPKLENLHALALAAGVPSVLDFLSGEVHGPSSAPERTLPSEEALQIVLDEVLRTSGDTELPPSILRPVSRHLLLCLELLSRRAATHGDPATLRALVDAAAAQPPLATPEA